MGTILLDVVDASIGRSFDWAPVLIISGTIIVEAVIMLLMKYNPFKKALLDSFLANAVSVGIGYVLMRIAPNFLRAYSLLPLAELMVMTIAIELGVLYLLNRKYPFVQTLKTCVVMNIVSYGLFYLYTLI